MNAEHAGAVAHQLPTENGTAGPNQVRLLVNDGSLLAWIRAATCLLAAAMAAEVLAEREITTITHVIAATLATAAIIAAAAGIRRWRRVDADIRSTLTTTCDASLGERR